MRALAASVLLMLAGCATQRGFISATLTDGCPKTGTCTLELLRDQSIVVDSTGGSIGYKTIPHTGHVVVVIKYKKTVKGNLQDADYREELIFLLDGSRDSVLTDAALSNANLLFGRFCFCKGQTGYYRVTNGSIAVHDRKVSLSFTVPGLPQTTHAFELMLQ